MVASLKRNNFINNNYNQYNNAVPSIILFLTTLEILTNGGEGRVRLLVLCTPIPSGS